MGLKQINNSFNLLIKVLILNLPLIGLILFKQFSGNSPYTFLSSIYLLTLVFGYYFLVQFILILPALFVFYLKKFSVFIAWFILSFFLYYLILDGIVYAIYRFHINLFFIELFFIDFENFGFTIEILLLGVGALLLSFSIEYWIFKLANRISNKVMFLIIPIILSYVLSQTIHIFAFENDSIEITKFTPQLPLYFPIESSKIAKKNKDFGNNIGLENGISDIEKSNLSINYPKKEFSGKITKDSLPNILFIVLESWRYDMLDSTICPNIYKFSRKSTYSPVHFSTGNSTTSGIFGLFYGLHPTYWEAVKANSSIIDNPVFIDILKNKNYQMGIFNHSNFDKFKLTSTIFNGLQVHNKFKGKYDWQKDQNMNLDLIAFLNEQKKADKPFFGFVFYTSTHHAYSYPKEETKFEPVGKINMGLVNNETDPKPFINAYKNSIFFVDKLVKNILQSLKSNNLDSNTIIILTSDHGEEFNDNKDNYWGHGSNFTKYQSSVPFMIYFPNKKAKTIQQATSHTDLIPTLIQEVFGVSDSTDYYSSGKNIYKLNSEIRPFIISSYVNHALIINENVYAVYPFGLKKYNLNDIKKNIKKTNNKTFRKAIEEMNWFFKN